MSGARLVDDFKQSLRINNVSLFSTVSLERMLKKRSEYVDSSYYLKSYLSPLSQAYSLFVFQKPGLGDIIDYRLVYVSSPLKSPRYFAIDVSIEQFVTFCRPPTDNELLFRRYRKKTILASYAPENKHFKEMLYVMARLKVFSEFHLGTNGLLDTYFNENRYHQLSEMVQYPFLRVIPGEHEFIWG